MLHPALPSCPGHELWRRDFTGSTSVFSVEFAPDVRRSRVRAFVDALELFEIGWSWGGVTSLAVPVNPPRTVADGRRAGALVRFNIGLEDAGGSDRGPGRGVARASGMSEDRRR